jgi:formiminoglutamase
MINLRDYFDPVSIERPLWGHLAEPSCLSHNLTISTASKPIENITGFKVAIIGVPDDRRSPNKGSGDAPNKIRESLYQLSRLPGKNKIADLGNIKQGPGFEDTLAALKDVLVYLLDHGCLAIILGGSSAIIPSIDRAFTEQEISYEFSSIDSRIDFATDRKEPDSFNYLGEILYNRKSTADAFVNIGYQSYLNDQQVINRFKKMNHNLIRIGEARADLLEIEPTFRDSSLISLDISAIRQSDAPGTFAPSPNGFYTEEICLLARYAGLSDSMKVFGLFEVNPLLDSRNQTSALAAQIIWFLLEGVSQKKAESKLIGKDKNGRFVLYHVSVKDLDEDLIFVKSTVTNRWWMKILSHNNKTRYVACSYNDYLIAGEGEIPARWMKAISKKV